MEDPGVDRQADPKLLFGYPTRHTGPELRFVYPKFSSNGRPCVPASLQHPTVMNGGGAEAVKRNKKRNKLLPRERIDRLIDPGSSLLEFSQAATGEEVSAEDMGVRECTVGHRVSRITLLKVSCAKVPKITVVVSGSFGAGNYAMCGRAYSPNFMFFWPNARISVMGGPQAAGVLSQIEQAHKKKEEEEKFKSGVVVAYDREGSAYYSTARLWDDDVIDPADTRKIAGLCVATSMNRKPADTKFGVFRM